MRFSIMLSIFLFLGFPSFVVRVRSNVELAAFATLRIYLHIVKAKFVAIVATLRERLAQAFEHRLR